MHQTGDAACAPAGVMACCRYLITGTSPSTLYTCTIHYNGSGYTGKVNTRPLAGASAT